MTVVNRSAQQSADQKLIDGLNKHKAVITALPIEGKTLTPAETIALVQARIDASSLSLTTKASAKAAVLAERAERASTKKFVSSLRQVIRSMFTSADDLADFGLTLPKPRKANPQKKVSAAVKAKATRVLRHTMGKKQKAAIKATGPLPAGTAASPAAPGNPPAAPVAPQSPVPTNEPVTATAPAAPAAAPTPGGGTAPAASPAGTTAPHAQS
jgi:hypothetical protein